MKNFRTFSALALVAGALSLWYCTKTEPAPPAPTLETDLLAAARDTITCDSFPLDSCSGYYFDCFGSIQLMFQTDACWWLEVYATRPCSTDSCLVGLYRSGGCGEIPRCYTVLSTGFPVSFPIHDDWVYTFRLHAAPGVSIKAVVTSPYTNYNLTVIAGTPVKKLLSCDGVLKACDEEDDTF